MEKIGILFRATSFLVGGMIVSAVVAVLTVTCVLVIADEVRKVLR